MSVLDYELQLFGGKRKKQYQQKMSETDEHENALTDNIPKEQDQPPEILVLQCSHCNCIVGDTTAWASADDILRTLSLKQASEKLLITDLLETSKNGLDIGSTYNVLKCGGCNEDLGKVYKTTPIQLDHLRGLFTLFVEKLSSYQVGNGQSISINDITSFADRDINRKVNKIQQVVISLDLRVKTIEQFLDYEDHQEINENVNQQELGNSRQEESNGTEPINNKENSNRQMDMVLSTQDEGYGSVVKPLYQQRTLTMQDIPYTGSSVNPMTQTRQDDPYATSNVKQIHRSAHDDHYSVEQMRTQTVADPPYTASSLNKISPQYNTTRFQPARHTFQKYDEENSRDSRRSGDLRHQNSALLNNSNSRASLESMKRKLGQASSRTDNSTQQIKRSKF